MKISYSKQFIKDSKKLNKSQKLQLVNRIMLFDENPTHPQLRNHQLKGAQKDYRSINITGDIRALYFVLNDEEVVFDTVGTHSRLYG